MTQSINLKAPTVSSIEMNQLSPEFLSKYEDKKPAFGPLGQLVFTRTYARELDDRRESWIETQARGVNALMKHSGGALTQELAEDLFDTVFNLKGSMSGRSLWQLGTKTVENIGVASLVSCWMTSITDLEDFCFAFDMLMLGGGVGANIQREYVYKLPSLKKKVPTIVHRRDPDVDFVVPDNREGWVELLRQVLSLHFESSPSRKAVKEEWSYSTHIVRGKGAAISGFGGVASGPQALIEGIDNIVKILRNRIGKQLRPVDCLDILDIIGAIVVAGNVRRSSILLGGDGDDLQFLNAKRWDMGNIPNWRSQSNNSVVCADIQYLSEEYWSAYSRQGETYGLVNMALARKKGRLIDSDRPEPDLVICNPCGEICASDGGNCNLVEIFLPNIKDEEEFIKTAKAVYRAAKIVSTIECHDPRSNALLKKNRRIGIGLTGIMQAPHLVQPEILDRVYRILRDYDVHFSAELSKALARNILPSVKLTCVKPSGSLSLLPTVSPGIHPEFSDYYIRRVRLASSDPLVAVYREANYPLEYVRNLDGTLDHNMMIISIPVKARPGRTANDVSAIEMLDTIKMIQTYWADNQVSASVYYVDEELPAIREWLSENYASSLKSVSFLRREDHGFDQAPLEAISEEEFNELNSSLFPVDMSSINGDDLDFGSCASGACPIK